MWVQPYFTEPLPVLASPTHDLPDPKSRCSGAPLGSAPSSAHHAHRRPFCHGVPIERAPATRKRHAEAARAKRSNLPQGTTHAAQFMCQGAPGCGLARGSQSVDEGGIWRHRRAYEKLEALSHAADERAEVIGAVEPGWVKKASMPRREFACAMAWPAHESEATWHGTAAAASQVMAGTLRCDMLAQRVDEGLHVGHCGLAVVDCGGGGRRPSMGGTCTCACARPRGELHTGAAWAAGQVGRKASSAP